MKKLFSDSVRKMCVMALTLPLMVSGTTSLATANENENEGKPYAIGLWGDLPYSDVQAATGMPNLIADMNANKLAFTVHDGDLKAGSNSLCDNALYTRSLGYFNALKAPAMFTPGDNDWTDCDRPNNGGFNANERLAQERKVFFSTPFSMGQRQLKQEVQAAPYVENRRWTVGKVTYATLHIVGSCNNLCDTTPDPQEYAARNQATIAWMRQTFQAAKARRSAAVMFVSQGNPGWDLSDPTRAPLRDPKTLVQTDGQPDGFKEFLLALRTEVIAFRKPVAYVHGDSHYYRIDQPFLDEQGRRLENFTRVETFGNSASSGNNDVRWVKVTVDVRNKDVFSYQAQTVPGNRVAVPAP
jgi:hypothetical protein